MAKKFLLYIHNPKFADEPQKSDLVNLLLDRHYDFFKPGTLIETIEADPRFDASVVGNAEAAEYLKPPVTKKPQVPSPKLVDPPFKPGGGQCEHGRGRKLCLEKNCKNYQFRKG